MVVGDDTAWVAGIGAAAALLAALIAAAATFAGTWLGSSLSRRAAAAQRARDAVLRALTLGKAAIEYFNIENVYAELLAEQAAGASDGEHKLTDLKNASILDAAHAALISAGAELPKCQEISDDLYQKLFHLRTSTLIWCDRFVHLPSTPDPVQDAEYNTSDAEARSAHNEATISWQELQRAFGQLDAVNGPPVRWPSVLVKLLLAAALLAAGFALGRSI